MLIYYAYAYYMSRYQRKPVKSNLFLEQKTPFTMMTNESNPPIHLNNNKNHIIYAQQCNLKTFDLYIISFIYIYASTHAVV